MSGTKIQARHVFQGEWGAAEREVWAAATGEPSFHWGHGSGRWRWVCGEQKRFAGWVETHGGSEALTFYHDGAGADVLGAWDPSPHKVLLMHRWPPRWERYVDWYLRHTGRLAVGSAALREAVQERFAWIPERYLGLFPTARLAETPCPAHLERRTLVWLWGQPWRACGNRLRAALEMWGSKGQAVLVVGGEGRRPLWAKGPGVTWESGLSFGEALAHAGTCDSVLMLNDFALQAPWIHDWVHGGLFLLVPDGGSPSRSGEWVEESAPRSYEWGNMEAAMALLLSWRSASAEERAAYRDWAGRAAQGESGALFEAEWERFKSGLWHQRAPKLGRLKARPSCFPVAWYRRIDRLRCGE